MINLARSGPPNLELSFHLQVNKYAFSGGGESKEDHRKHGANLDVDVPFKYLSFFLDDDEQLETIRRDYGSGAMFTGEVKKTLIELLSAMVGRHQAARAMVTEEVRARFLYKRFVVFV